MATAAGSQRESDYRADRAAGERSVPLASRRDLDSAVARHLEFVTQAELEHTRLGERGRVLSEAGRIQNAGIGGVRVEPHGVGDIERLGAKLQCVWLVLECEQGEALADS